MCRFIPYVRTLTTTSSVRIIDTNDCESFRDVKVTAGSASNFAVALLNNRTETTIPTQLDSGANNANPSYVVAAISISAVTDVVDVRDLSPGEVKRILIGTGSSEEVRINAVKRIPAKGCKGECGC